jgi:phosphoribosylanthranilate isomerase
LIGMAAKRTRIKICGLTQAIDVQEAVALGTDALGFVFYPPSKRCITVEQAAELSAELPAFVSTVALFVQPESELVQSVIDQMRPGYLQFHGDETVQECEQFDWPYIKAFRVGAPGLDSPEGLAQVCQRYASASAWLFDSYTPAYGGSGHGFDRALLGKVIKLSNARPIVVSGGLQAEVISEVISELRPWAVDVSSGVEVSAGIKSHKRMQAFFHSVRSADQRLSD